MDLDPHFVDQGSSKLGYALDLCDYGIFQDERKNSKKSRDLVLILLGVGVAT